MLNSVSLTHEEQQKAAERIHELMAQGISSGQAIQMIADEIRKAAEEKSAAKED